jgi:hypothetical protein
LPDSRRPAGDLAVEPLVLEAGIAGYPTSRDHDGSMARPTIDFHPTAVRVDIREHPSGWVLVYQPPPPDTVRRPGVDATVVQPERQVIPPADFADVGDILTTIRGWMVDTGYQFAFGIVRPEPGFVASWLLIPTA